MRSSGRFIETEMSKAVRELGWRRSQESHPAAPLRTTRGNCPRGDVPCISALCRLHHGQILHVMAASRWNKDERNPMEKIEYTKAEIDAVPKVAQIIADALGLRHCGRQT